MDSFSKTSIASTPSLTCYCDWLVRYTSDKLGVVHKKLDDIIDISVNFHYKNA